MSKFKLWLIMKLIGNKPFVANVKMYEFPFYVLTVQNKDVIVANVEIVWNGKNNDRTIF